MCTHAQQQVAEYGMCQTCSTGCVNCMENLAEAKLSLLQRSAVGDPSQERGRTELCFKRQPAMRSDLTSY